MVDEPEREETRQGATDDSGDPEVPIRPPALHVDQEPHGQPNGENSNDHTRDTAKKTYTALKKRMTPGGNDMDHQK